MPDLRELPDRFKRLEQELPNIFNKGLRTAAKTIGEKVIEATPRRTGRLQHNWQADNNQASSYDSRAKGTEDAAKKELNKSIDKLQLHEKSKLYLNNPAPYAHAKLDRDKIKGAIRDPEVKRAIGRTIKAEIGKALRGE